MDPETREALERLERGLREEIQSSAAATHHVIAEVENRMRGHVDVRFTDFEDRMRGYLDVRFAGSEERMRGYVDIRLAESENRIRRHFDVVAESLRADTRSLAEGIMAVAEGSMRRDAQLGDRVDRVEHRVLGLEARVSVLERPRPRRRRRR